MSTGPIIDVEVFGEPVIRRRILGMGERAYNAAPALRRVMELLRESTREQFKTEGEHGGARWQELKPATTARKAALSQRPEILRATDRLMNSLLSPTATRDHIQHVRRDELRWGSRVPYGVFHMSRAPRTRLPRRPPIALTELEKRKATKEIQSFIVGQRRAA